MFARTFTLRVLKRAIIAFVARNAFAIEMNKEGKMINTQHIHTTKIEGGFLWVRYNPEGQWFQVEPDELLAENRRLKNEVRELEWKIKDVEDEVEHLERTIEEREDEIHELEVENEDLQLEIDNLKHDLQ